MKRFALLSFVFMAACSYGQNGGRVQYVDGVPGVQSPDCNQVKVVMNSLTGDRYVSQGTPCAWVLKESGGALPAGVTSDGANGLAVQGAGTFGNVAMGAYEPNIPFAAILQKAIAASPSPVTLAVAGDSISANSWPPLVFDKLAENFGGSTGRIYPYFIGYGVLAGSWTPVPSVGIYEAAVVTSVQRGTASATFTAPAFANFVDTVTVYFYTYTDSQAFTVYIDAANVGTCGGTVTGTYTPGQCSFTVTNLPSGHTVSLTTAASGGAYVWGWGFSLGTGGMRYVNLAVPGSNCAAYSTDTSWLKFLPANSVLIDGCGANDGWANSSAIIASKNAIFTAATALGIPEAQLITNPGTSQSAGQDTVVSAVAAWASAQGMPVANVWGNWGLGTRASALGLISDGVHPSLNGQADIARIVLSQIFGGIIPNPASGTWFANSAGWGTAGFHMVPSQTFLIDGSYNPAFRLAATAPNTVGYWQTALDGSANTVHTATVAETFNATQFNFNTTANNAVTFNSAAGNSMGFQVTSDHYANVVLKNTASPYGAYVDFFFNNADAWLIGFLNSTNLQFRDRANNHNVVEFMQGGPDDSLKVDATGKVVVLSLGTATNCAVNSVSPAACGSAASGAVVIPTTTTTYTVNTTAVTAASRIFLFPRTYAGDLPSAPTCVAPAVTSAPTVSAITAATSFTIALPSTSGQTCWNYEIVN